MSQVDPLLRGIIDSWIVAARAKDPELFFQVTYPTNFSEAWIAANQAALDGARARYRTLDFDAVLELLLSFSRLNITSELKQITAPTLVIVGEQDILKPRKYAEIIAREVPNKRIRRRAQFRSCRVLGTGGIVQYVDCWAFLQSIHDE